MMSFNELRDALEEAWDQGNACGLDGYVGPGRGTEPIDDEAIYARDRDVDRIMHRCHKAADLSVNPHARIVDAIWTELERQRDTERFGPCVGRADDLIDGHVDMDAVATAVIDVLPLSIHDDDFRLHHPGATARRDTSSSRLSPTPTASPPNMCHTGQFRSTP